MVRVAGIVDGTVVGYTASKTIACGTGYSGPATYSCLTNGAAPTVISGCTPIQCTFSGTAGIANGTTVGYTNSGSRACDAGFSGGPITYQCLSSGAPTSIAGTCAPIQCTFSGTEGITNGTTVGYTNSATKSCDVVGYSGSVTYSCLSSGSAPTILSGSCAPIQCTFNGITGVANGTKVNYTATALNQACNVSGYSGSISYTCNSSGVLTTSGSCGASHWVLENSNICYLVNIGSDYNYRVTCSQGANNMIIYVTSTESAPTQDLWRIYGAFYYALNGPAPMYCIWGNLKCSDGVTDVSSKCTQNWQIRSYRCVYP